MNESSRGAHSEEPAEGGREQGEEAEARVREETERQTARSPAPDQADPDAHARADESPP